MDFFDRLEQAMANISRQDDEFDDVENYIRTRRLNRTEERELIKKWNQKSHESLARIQSKYGVKLPPDAQKRQLEPR
jgi:serine/threonine-protein kinase RIO1